MPKQYDITIPKKTIDDLVHIEKEMSKILKDEEDLCNTIIENIICFDTSNNLSRRGLENLILKKYPDLYSNHLLSDKRKLFSLMLDLEEIVLGKNELSREFFKKNTIISPPPKNWAKFWANYQEQFQKALDVELTKIFFTGDIAEDNNINTSQIIGNVSQEFNNMEL